MDGVELRAGIIRVTWPRPTHLLTHPSLPPSTLIYLGIHALLVGHEGSVVGM